MAYKKIEQYDQDVTDGLLKNYKEALAFLGEDPEREGKAAIKRLLSVHKGFGGSNTDEIKNIFLAHKDS